MNYNYFKANGVEWEYVKVPYKVKQISYLFKNLKDKKYLDWYVVAESYYGISDVLISDTPKGLPKYQLLHDDVKDIIPVRKNKQMLELRESYETLFETAIKDINMLLNEGLFRKKKKSNYNYRTYALQSYHCLEYLMKKHPNLYRDERVSKEQFDNTALSIEEKLGETLFNWRMIIKDVNSNTLNIKYDLDEMNIHVNKDIRNSDLDIEKKKYAEIILKYVSHMI